MRRWRALLLGAVFVGAFSALAVLVVREKELRGWLADTAPLAQWAVAAGTFTLALATFILARRASEEARAIGEEAAVVAEQVALQREQAGLAARPIAYPTVTPLWTESPRRKGLAPGAQWRSWPGDIGAGHGVLETDRRG